MSTNKQIIAVHVWADGPTAAMRNCDEYYSVSEVDCDGDEIRCIGGSKSLREAWEMGCEHADDLRVECIEMAREGSDEITDRYKVAEARDDEIED